MADSKLTLTPEQLADFFDKFKEKCQLASAVHQPFDLGSLTENLNDPDIQRLLDAEHGDIDAEVFRYLAYKKANTGNISNLINFGKLSDKDEKSARIKHILRSIRLTQRIDNKTKEIEKRNKLLQKDIEQLKTMMIKKNTELDENVKTIEENIAMEIGNIKKNINAFKEKEKQMKSKVDKETKKLKADEARAKADMERKIEEMKITLTKEKEATDKSIQEKEEYEAKAKRYFDKRIQKLKDTKRDMEQEIRILKSKDIENKNVIDAKLTEIQKRKEENFKKSIEILRLYEDKKTRELDAKHQQMNENYAQDKENIIKKIKAMQNTLSVLEEELKNSIETMRQQEAKKKLVVEDTLKKINEIKGKINSPTQITSEKKKRQIADVEFQRGIDTLQQYEAEKARKTEREFQDVKGQKKDSIEKNLEPRRKRIALNERNASSNQLSVHTRLHSQIKHEALTPSRLARQLDYPRHRMAIVAERRRRSQRSHHAANASLQSWPEMY